MELLTPYIKRTTNSPDIRGPISKGALHSVSYSLNEGLLLPPKRRSFSSPSCPISMTRS